MKLSIKKILLAVLFLSSVFSSWAVSKSEKYDSLMKEGSAPDIVRAFMKDSSMSQTKIGPDKDSILMTAIKYGRPESILNLVLKGGVSISYKNKNKQNALMYVCMYSNDISSIKLIIKKSGNTKKVAKLLQEKDKNGKTAFDYAQENPDPVASEYISKYANGNIPADNEDTEESAHNPVITIENDSEPEDAEPAVEKTVSEPAEESSAENVLERAETVQPDNVPEEPAAETVPVPVAPVPVPEPEIPVQSSPTVSKYDKTYLYDYIQIEEDTEPEAEPETEALAFINNPDKKDKNGRTQLMNAVKDGNDWEIKSLIHSNADVNLKDKDGWTALMYAVRYQNSIEIVNLLLDSGANASVKNNFGATALQLASTYSGNPDIVKKLISVSLPDSEELFKAFILSITSSNNNTLTQVTKIRIYIERGIAINRFYEGKTPLMYAAEYSSSTDIIKLLLDNGAVSGIRTSDGKTAFNFAESNKHLEHNDTYWSLNGR